MNELRVVLRWTSKPPEALLDGERPAGLPGSPRSAPPQRSREQSRPQRGVGARVGRGECSLPHIRALVAASAQAAVAPARPELAVGPGPCGAAGTAHMCSFVAPWGERQSVRSLHSGCTWLLRKKDHHMTAISNRVGSPAHPLASAKLAALSQECHACFSTTLRSRSCCYCGSLPCPPIRMLWFPLGQPEPLVLPPGPLLQAARTPS